MNEARDDDDGFVEPKRWTPAGWLDELVGHAVVSLYLFGPLAVIKFAPWAWRDRALPLLLAIAYVLLFAWNAPVSVANWLVCRRPFTQRVHLARERKEFLLMSFALPAGQIGGLAFIALWAFVGDKQGWWRARALLDWVQARHWLVLLALTSAAYSCFELFRRLRVTIRMR